MNPQAILPYVVLFVVAVAVCLALEPWAIRWAAAVGAFDAPSRRRVNKTRVPRGGGLVFLPCVALPLGIVRLFWPALWRPQYTGLIVALVLITCVGLWDDVKGLRARFKLSFQILCGILLFFSGYRLEDVSIPFTKMVVHLSTTDFLITVIGVAAIINAVNMLDGLDGLAAGSVFIMCLFLLINKAAEAGADSLVVLVSVMGAALGFLCFNFHPARVFMGDSGSMFLGLALAAETFDSASQGAAVTTIMLPLVILAVPVLDMARTIVTRMRASRNIFEADKNHLHHRLLSLGLSHREAVVFIYGLNCYMGIMALLYKHVESSFRGLFLLALGLFLVLASYLITAGRRVNNSDAPEEASEERH